MDAHSDMSLHCAHMSCAQRGLKSDCASMQSDQTIHCPYENTLHPWLSKMHPVKIPSKDPDQTA